MAQEENEKAQPKFGTKASQEDLAQSLSRLKERVDSIASGPSQAEPSSRYSDKQPKDFKITRGYKPIMDESSDLTSKRPPHSGDPLSRIPAQKVIKEAEKRIALLKTFSPNAIQAQTQAITLESARESFNKGDYDKATEVAKHILENLDETFMKQVHNETAKGISKAFSIISSARMLGLDVASANRKMDQAQNAFMEDDYSICNRLINEVMNEITHLKNEHLKEKVQSLLSRIEETLTQFPLTEAESTHVAAMKERVQSLFRRGNLDEAYTLSNQLLDLILKMKDIHLRSAGG